jgi:hypothetical protein
MPRIVGTLLIQNTQVLAQGNELASGANTGIVIPTGIDGGQVRGIAEANIEQFQDYSIDGGTVS